VGKKFGTALFRAFRREGSTVHGLNPYDVGWLGLEKLKFDKFGCPHVDDLEGRMYID
jgi:hypothetical protein